MSYRQSRARRDFESQLSVISSDLSALHQLAKHHGSNTKMIGAFYVLAYSHLELYIKSFIEDSLDALNAAAPTINKMPDLMVAYILHRGQDLGASYRKFSLDENEGALLEKVAAVARSVESWTNGNSNITPASASEFLDKRKYPSPRNMPALFKRLGVKQIWAVIGKAGKMNGELILTSLNDLRTGIAHEGTVPPGFGIRDFKNRLEQMRRFVAALDRGVSSHFCSDSIPRGVWNNSMT